MEVADLRDFNEIDTDAFWQDPGPAFAGTFAARQRLMRIPGDPGIMVTGYHEAREVVNNRSFGVPGPDALWEGQPALHMLFGPSLLHTNPPELKRRKALINRPLSPRSVEAMQPQISDVVDAALAEIEPARPMDFVEEIAAPIARGVVASLLQVDDRVARELQHHASDIRLALRHAPTVESARAGARGAVAMRAILVELASERAASDTASTDFLGHVALGMERQGSTDPAAAAAGICAQVVFDGIDTTKYAIASAVQALAAHPGSWTAVRRSASAAAQAREEALRWETPSGVTVRVAMTDTRIGEVDVPAGTTAGLWWYAANRDPAIYREPTVFRLDRGSELPHQAFGGGDHFCSGAALARAEIGTVLEQITQRFDGLATAEPPVWSDRVFARGMDRWLVEANLE